MATGTTGSRLLVSAGEDGVIDYMDASYGGAVRTVATVSGVDGSIVINDMNGNAMMTITPAGAIAWAAAQTLTAASGAIALGTGTTFLANTAAGTYTLANGTVLGQWKRIVEVYDGTHSSTLTVATKNGFAGIVLGALHAWVELEWTATGWAIIGYTGATIT